MNNMNNNILNGIILNLQTIDTEIQGLQAALLLYQYNLKIFMID